MTTFLDILVIAFKIILIVAVCGILAIGGIMVCDLFADARKAKRSKSFTTRTSIVDMLRKEEIRRQKEAEANEGFFEESCVWTLDATGAWNFRVVRRPTTRAIHYYRLMDALVDDPIFQNTEEL